MRGARIAYLAFEPFPNEKGSGTRIAELGRGLVEAGAEVHVVTLPGSRLPPPLGLVHHALRVDNDNYLQRALAFRDQVARRLRSIRPDVIHFRGIFEGQAAMSHARRERALTLFEVNGLPSVELRYHHPAAASASFEAKLRAIEAELLSSSGAVITQSETTRRFLATRGLTAGTPCSVIPNAADPALFCPPESATRTGRLRLLYAGTLAPWQGVAELLMAVRRLSRAVPVELCIAGRVARRHRRSIERVTRRLGLEASLELAGAVARRELASLVAASDICLAPLRRDLRNRIQGASPIKLFEYMSAARPIVTTDLPCVREIVEDERNALCVHTPRPAHLAAHLERLAADPALCARLGDAARRHIIAHATWDHRRRELARAYDALLASA
jgi:glycosyltransferase involved in cell wall biosynthesis